MKRIYRLFVAMALIMGATTIASCNKDKENEENSNGNGNNNGNVTNQDLIGNWHIEAQDQAFLFNFTADKMTEEEIGCIRQEYSYTYNNGIMRFSPTRVWYYDQETGQYVEDPDAVHDTTYVTNVTLLDNKGVLLMRETIEPWAEGMVPWEEIFFMYNSAKTVTSDIATLQGKWYWFMYGQESMVRVAVIFENNRFDLMIPVWGQRYTGTYTYADGVIHMTMDHYYSGADDQAPESAVYEEQDFADGLYQTLDMPFFANGNEAYGVFANLTMLLKKQ